MGSNISQHIDNARKTGVCSLAGKNLSEVPPQLFKLGDSLRTLDLSGNKFKSLPPEIGELTGLKNLTLSSNRFETLPKEINKLKKLETFAANKCSIKLLPAGVFTGLHNLKKLEMSSNQISTFPDEICSLRHIDFIDLSDNKLKLIPDNIGELQAMELNLNANQISYLPHSLAACPRMKVLRLEENCLPLDAVKETLLKESRLSLLALDGNLFTKKELREKEGYDQYMERFTATKKKFT
ncbi:leucine-rich repeat-containing protein 57-like [Actinia tenebrosa]|uniref:Leucine-rich repeat-containing protein 57-like n=1 Tax=Actinia tenebrosa TaxID=6105 RepID=A0A6P8H953_ACTTE|nr:leucine-rich repeat-containing protein 57-like [Actinia tenebrosa]